MNRKRILLLTSIILLICITFTNTIFADIRVTAIVDRVKVMINGKSSDCKTIVYDGTTYVALRDAGEIFGKEVSWDGVRNIAHIDDKGTDRHIKTELEVINEQYDNTTPIGELLTTDYVFPNDSRISNHEKFIDQVERINIECLRKIDDNNVYTVYKTTEGRWVFTFYSYNKEKSRFYRTNKWTFIKPVYKHDFDKIKIGTTSIIDVRNEVDRYGDDSMIHMSRVIREPSTYHQTIDGYFIEIVYLLSDDNSSKHVQEVKITDDVSKTAYGRLLPIDQEFVDKISEEYLKSMSY